VWRLCSILVVSIMPVGLLFSSNSLEPFDTVLERRDVVATELLSWKSGKKLPNGVIRGDGFFKIEGSKAPGLITFEDMMPHFLAYISSEEAPVYHSLRNRGMKQHDIDVVASWLREAPKVRVNAKMMRGFETFRESLRQELVGKVSEEQAANFAKFQKRLYSDIHLAEINGLFSGMTKQGQRVFLSYLSERFSSMTRIYWLEVPQRELILYRQALDRATSLSAAGNEQ